MKIKFITLISFLLLCAYNLGYGDDLSGAQSLFYQANDSYAKEDFVRAAEYYEEAISLGCESGPLYYNLGNSYFKQGFLGKAILNYLRAKRLMPKDADLKSNLIFADLLIKQRTAESRKIWLERVFFDLAASFNLDAITLLTSIIYFMLSLVVILAMLKHKKSKGFRSAIFGLLFLLISCLSILYVRFLDTVVKNEAVVITETADSKFEPFSDATTHFIVYEGESVFIIKTQDDWVKIKRIDGKQGWIPKHDIEFL